MRFMNEVDYVLATAATATLKLGATVSLFIFVSAIVATNILWDARDEMIASMFSSLGTSMWSLFKLMTLDDWIVISDKVTDEKPGMKFFFITFIFTTSMALISLVPAIFIEITLSSKQRADKLHDEVSKESARRQKEKSLRTLFKVTDVDNNGKVSLDELRNVLSDSNSIKRLRDAGLTQPKELEDVRLGLFDLWEARLEEMRQHTTAIPLESVEMSEEEFITSLTTSEHDLSQMTIWRTTTATRLMLQELCITLRCELEEIRVNQRQASMQINESVERGLQAKGSKEFDEFDKEMKFLRDGLDATREDLSAMLIRSTSTPASSSKAFGASIGFTGKLASMLGRDSPKTIPRENHLGDAQSHGSLNSASSWKLEEIAAGSESAHNEQQASLRRQNLDATEHSSHPESRAGGKRDAPLEDELSSLCTPYPSPPESCAEGRRDAPLEDELSSIRKAVPKRIQMTGCIGTNSSIINGLYDLQVETYEGKPLWRKNDNADVWLLAFPDDNSWHVTNHDFKERRNKGGWARAGGGYALPTSELDWQKYDGHKWESSSISAVPAVPQEQIAPHATNVGPVPRIRIGL